jgi:hypothetical protein
MWPAGRSLETLDLDHETDYAAWDVSWPSSKPGGKFRHITSNYGTIPLSYVLSNSLRADYLKNRRYAVWAADSVIKRTNKNKTLLRIYKLFVRVIFIIVITQFRVAIATNGWVLTCCCRPRMSKQSFVLVLCVLNEHWQYLDLDIWSVVTV